MVSYWDYNLSDIDNSVVIILCNNNFNSNYLDALLKLVRFIYSPVWQLFAVLGYIGICVLKFICINLKNANKTMI